MWRDSAWVLDMLRAAQRVLEYGQGLTEAEFMESPLHQDAILRQLTILGEATKRVSPEFRAEHPQIPWRKIAGFRDVVVHDYSQVNLRIVWQIVQEELPSLVIILQTIVPSEEQYS